MHWRDGCCELPSDVIGFSATFGDVSLDASLEADLLGNVDEHGEVEMISDVGERQEEDAFDDHDGPGLDHHDIAGPGVGREVVDGRGDRLPASNRSDIGSESLMVE